MTLNPITRSDNDVYLAGHEADLRCTAAAQVTPARSSQSDDAECHTATKVILLHHKTSIVGSLYCLVFVDGPPELWIFLPNIFFVLSPVGQQIS